MRELVERIVKHIVDNPDQVVVHEIQGEGSTLLEISTAKEDMGKVVGKGGANCQCTAHDHGGRCGKAEEACGRGDSGGLRLLFSCQGCITRRREYGAAYRWLTCNLFYPCYKDKPARYETNKIGIKPGRKNNE